MDREAALRQLGLEAGAPESEIGTAYWARRRDVESRESSARTAALRAKYRDQVRELEAAYALLAQSSNVQSGLGDLSGTQMQDLPGLTPSYTITGGSGGHPGPVLQLGQVLSSRYEVRRLLGEGGMGTVYAVFDRNRDEEIALKVMQPTLLQNEQAVERFLNEARTASSLSHPNIVNVFDVGRDADLYFLTMELLEGMTLRERVDHLSSVGQRLDIEDILKIADALCDALSYAHSKTIHRDVKPENVFLTDDGEVKLMDFGIARVMRSSQLTKTSAALGTAYYMAPEQLKGKRELDHRADQYAVGVLLYELLTGELPAGRVRTASELREDCPSGLAEAIDQAMEQRPQNRHTDMRALQLGLRNRRRLHRLVRTSAKYFILGAIVVAGTWITWLARDSRDTEPSRQAVAQPLNEPMDLANAPRKDDEAVEAKREQQRAKDPVSEDSRQREAGEVPAETAHEKQEETQDSAIEVRLSVLRSTVDNPLSRLEFETAWKEIETLDPDNSEAHALRARVWAGPGAVITNSIGMTLQEILPGKFHFGIGPNDELPGIWDDYLSHQEVRRLQEPILISVTEVTRGQWKAVMGTTPWDQEGPVQTVTGKPVTLGLQQPATSVSWSDANRFCEKLSAQEGRTYRLPTSPEWECAARGGTSTTYSFGDDFSQLDDYAWLATGFRSPPEPVAGKLPNPFGLFDVHGNVWEWCQEWVTAWDALSEHSRYAIIRGGSRENHDAPAFLLAGQRLGEPDFLIGFRVVLSHK